jgi:hypothetical protein
MVEIDDERLGSGSTCFARWYATAREDHPHSRGGVLTGTRHLARYGTAVTRTTSAIASSPGWLGDAANTR